MHRVKFLVKNVEENHPEYKLVTDRTADFNNFSSAMDFIRTLRQKLTAKEVLIGQPVVEVR